MAPAPKVCPVCREDFRSSEKTPDYYDSKRLYKIHLQTNHPEFDRWNRKTSWGYIIAAMFFFGFPIAGYASRSRNTAELLLILSWISFLAVGATTLVVKDRGAKRFHESWKEEHPLGK